MANRSMTPSRRLIRRVVDPAPAQIGDRHQDKRDPEIFELPPPIEDRAAGDDQAKPVLSRNQEMKSEIDGKEDKENGRAEYHDSRSINSSPNGARRTGSDMRPTLRTMAQRDRIRMANLHFSIGERAGAGCASTGKTTSAISLWA